MSMVGDFRRLHNFDIVNVNRSGQFVGQSFYWKLYFVENAFRVIINSVLSITFKPDWWEDAVKKKIKDNVEWRRRDYLASPWHTNPGKHGIYYVHLSNLGDIIRDNANLFRDIIPNIDDWVADIEKIRLPRNVVGHMNFINRDDQRQIDLMYRKSKVLVRSLQREKVVLKIPDI